MNRRPVVMGILVGLASLSGCGGAAAPEAAGAGRAALAFTRAVTSHPDGACGLLAPETRQEFEDASGPCREAISDARLPQSGRVLNVEIYGQDAIVRLDHDTMFLALFDDGWRVTAAGC